MAEGYSDRRFAPELSRKSPVDSAVSRLLLELHYAGVFLLEHLLVSLAVSLGLRDLRLLYLVVRLHRATVFMERRGRVSLYVDWHVPQQCVVVETLLHT